MVNPVIEQIYKHSSIRRYKPDPVPRDQIEQLIAAGQRGSTSSNLQTYSAIVVTDQETRYALAELCGDQKHVREAPVFIAWCADLQRLERICDLRGLKQNSDYVEDFLVSAVDVSILMQTATLAAESMGLGMCFIGGIRNDTKAVIKLLKMPDLVFPISGMTLGWPDGKPNIRARLEVGEIIHWEKYDRDRKDSVLIEYDQKMIESGVYRGRQVPMPGVEGEMEDYGWMEHSARRVSKALRVELRSVVEEQGFKLL
jgi:nitroreductase